MNVTFKNNTVRLSELDFGKPCIYEGKVCMKVELVGNPSFKPYILVDLESGQTVTYPPNVNIEVEIVNAHIIVG